MEAATFAGMRASRTNFHPMEALRLVLPKEHGS
jgi:hypothetical protein